MDPICELTVFDNVACASTVSRGAHPVRNPLHVTDTESITDIVKYLSRPYVVTSGTLDNNAAVVIWQTNLNLASYFSSNPNWAKTQNAYGLRFTVCLKLQVLSTPQHSGLYRLLYQPLTNSKTNTTQMSYLPHAQLNLINGTEATLKIPYIHYDTFMRRNASSFNLGAAKLFALVPTGYATGELPPTYRIWSWLEDVELIAATSSNAQTFVSQMGTKVTPVKPIKAAKPVTAKQPKSASNKEIVPAALSSILASGGVAVDFVGKMIPSLKSFTGTTSWALNYAADLAYSFGWSKPRDTSPIHKIYKSINTGQHNVDGVNNSHNMGLLAENALAPSSLGGTDVDEMSLAYILSRPGITTRLSLTTASTVNSTLYNFSVSPSYLTGIESGNHNTALQTTGSLFPSMLLYYANDFKFWRGTIKVRLTASLTSFHAGRLLVGFVPTDASYVPSVTEALNFKSVVWDLRDNSILEFDIPFIYTRPYCPFTGYTGTFFVKVLDTLVAPNNVSTTVPIIVEHWGGEDFECARPANPTLVPMADSFTSQMSDQVYSIDARSPADLCMGESIRSVKQLINKACFLSTIVPNTYINLTNLNYSNTITGSQAVKWKSCFCFWRGSYDFHVIPNNQNMMLTAAIGSTTVAFNNPQNLGVAAENSALHFSVPFYCNTPMYAAGQTTTNNSDITLFSTIPPQATPDTNASAAIFGNYGDDTQFFFFTGPPKVEARPSAMKPFDDAFWLWARRLLRTAPNPTSLVEVSNPIDLGPVLKDETESEI